MRVKTSYTQLNISEAEAHNWNPHLLNYKEIAALVYKLFGNCAKTETQVQIFNAINTFNFGWRIEDREVEEESYANLCKLVTDHYGPLASITTEVHQTISKLIYKKLPGHTEMHKLYTDETKIDIDENGPDTITRALDRYLSVIQTVRNITEKAKAYRIANDEFYSGPTLESPHKESSKDKVISYGKNAQRARQISVLPKVYNTDYGEMARTANNRCETCGRNNHTREIYRLFGNPMANNFRTKWQLSQVGKAWQAIGLHKWTSGRHVRGYGLAQYNADIPIPKNHV